MAASLIGVSIAGRVTFSVVPESSNMFEGFNLTLQLPISFGGSPTTFTTTNTALQLPISFSEGDAITFTSTVQSNLPISFHG
jgi:hypothetical protein